MDQATQKNAAMVEETTAASHALASEAESLRDLLTQFDVGASPQQRARPAAARPQSPPVSPLRMAHANLQAKAVGWKEF
jgi:methyl-accepting chemotaxis protein